MTDSPQFPSLLSSYPTRPSWQVAGVDYYVGCPSAQTLQVPSATNLPPNAQWYNGQVNFIYGNATVVGWDFTGIPVTINAQTSNVPFNVSFTNCRFNLSSSNLVVPLTIYTTSNVTITNCDFYGFKINSSSTNPQMVYVQQGCDANGWANTINLTVSNCYFSNIPDHGIDFSANGTFIFTQNLAYGIGYAANNHADIIQFASGQTINSQVTYNTVVTTTDQASNGSQGIQVDSQLGGSVNNFNCSNNVIIFQGSSGLQSYSIALNPAANELPTLSGICENNYIDYSGGDGPFYPLVAGMPIYTSGNINLSNASAITVANSASSPPLAPGFVNSCQTFAITIPTGATSASATLSAPVGFLAAIRTGGFTTNDTTGNAQQFLPALSLTGQGTSTATVTATRNASSTTTTVTVYGTVVDYTVSMVNTVQYGSVAVSNATSGTATLATAVNPAAAAVYIISVESTLGTSATLPEIMPYVQLTYPTEGETQVVANLNTSPGTSTVTVYFVVVEYQVAILNQPVQPFILTSAAAANETQTINSVVTGNAIIENAGMALAATNMRGIFEATLTNSTTVTFSCGVATPAATTRTHAFTVVEFVPNVIKVQRGSVALSAATSATATITNVNPVNAYLNNNGFKSTQTGSIQGDYFIAQSLTNGTTVTCNVGTSSTGGTSFEVVQIIQQATMTEAGAATDSLDATDVPHSGNTYSVTETENGSATDTVAAGNITSASIAESGSATDATSATYSTTAIISESGSAGDNVAGANTTNSAVTESGSATDTVAAGNMTHAVVAETGNSTDTLDGADIGTRAVTVSDQGDASDTLDAVLSVPTPYVVGSLGDMLGRLLTNLPGGWFPQSSSAVPPSTSSPILAGLLTGPAQVFSWVYSQLLYTRQQLRIATATGFNLDIISLDYFGMNLPRRLGETDAAFSSRIRANLFIPKGTRASVIAAVTTLTGVAPTVFEPTNANDTGGYATITQPTVWTGLAYNYAGGYGSLNYPYQMFVVAQRAVGVIKPQANVNGYSGYLSGYATLANPSIGANAEYLSGQIPSGQVSDAEIYQTIADNMPAGTIAWTALTD